MTLYLPAPLLLMLVNLPSVLLRKIGRYLPVIDHVKLEMVIRQKIENPRLLRLRFRYEPLIIGNISCNYVVGAFRLKWSHNGYNLHWNDNRSRSNREAIRRMDDLLN